MKIMWFHLANDLITILTLSADHMTHDHRRHTCGCNLLTYLATNRIACSCCCELISVEWPMFSSTGSNRSTRNARDALLQLDSYRRCNALSSMHTPYWHAHRWLLGYNGCQQAKNLFQWVKWEMFLSLAKVFRCVRVGSILRCDTV